MGLPVDGIDEDARVDLDPTNPKQVEEMRTRLDELGGPPGMRPSMKTLRARQKRQGALGAHVPQEERPNVNDSKPAYTRAQANAQLHLVEELVLRGVRSTRTIQDVLAKRLGQHVSTHRIRTLVDRVQQQWSFEDSQYRAVAKASAERRILKYIQGLEGKAVGSQAEPGKPALYAHIHKFEELLSKIQGTQEPIQLSINARVTEAMMQVIGVLDEGTMKSLIAEQHALEQAFRSMTPMELSHHDTSQINGTPVSKVVREPAEDNSLLVDESPPPYDDAFTRATQVVQAHRAGKHT